MPIVTPTKSLPGIKLKEFFPLTAAVNIAPAFAETLIGPIRTVVSGEKGILGGPSLDTLPVFLSAGEARWEFVVRWPNPSGTGVDHMILNFAGLSIKVADGVSAIYNPNNNKTADGFALAVMSQINANPHAAALVKDFRITDASAVGGFTTRRVTILASEFAISTGYHPDLLFFPNLGPTAVEIYEADDATLVNAAITGTGILKYTCGTETVIPFPPLNTNWSEIHTREISEQVEFGIDTEPERHYFDITARMSDKLNEYLGLSNQERTTLCDYTTSFPGLSASLNFDISKDPLLGTQRLTAVNINSGVERELKYTEDYLLSSVRVGGAYQLGDTVIPLVAGVNLVAAGYGVDPLLIRAVYIPRRDIMPLPVAKYTALVPGAKDVFMPVEVKHFTVDEGAGSFSVEKFAPPTAARISYTTAVKLVMPSVSGPATVSFAPSLLKTIIYDASTLVDIDLDAQNTPGLDIASLVITRSDGVTLTPATDYAITGHSVSFTPGGPHNSTAIGNNPLTLRYRYSPPVQFVGSPTIKYTSSSSFPGFAPTLTNIGGGQFEATVPPPTGSVVRIDMTDFGSGYATPPAITFSAGAAAATAVLDFSIVSGLVITNPGSAYLVAPTVIFTGGGFTTTAAATAVLGGATAGDVVGTFLVSATVEYPVQPEIQLEFTAERSDLDGQLFVWPTESTISSEALLQDTFSGQAILPDLTVANPTLHAAKIATSISPGVPVICTVGDMTADRSSKALLRLEREPNAYHLVAVSQDADAVLTYVGAHVDKVVATLGGDQIHFNPGNFRVMYATLDQRNEVQVMPIQTDTLATAVGKLVNFSGGIAVQANMVGITGDITTIQPGDFVEFYQVDATNTDSITGSATVERAKARRLQISSVDYSTLSSTKFSVVDASLPPTLDGTTTFHIEMAGAFRIVRVRSDYQLATDLHDKVEAIGAAPNGRRRWIRQPDLVFLNDSGTIRSVPGYYRSVIEAAIRANSLPHQPMTNETLPLLTGVKRNVGYYVTDDIINIMTDGGIDYAVQLVNNGPVFSVQNLTADRTNSLTQIPATTQIADFVGSSLRQTLKIYIGVTNVFAGTIEGIAALTESVFKNMQSIRNDRLGPMLLGGRIDTIEELPLSSVNSGIKMKCTVRVPQELDEIDIDLFVDSAPL